MRCKTLAMLLTLVFLGLTLPFCSASVTANNPVDLGYGNGTYIELPVGTHDNITRINNVWYVNGSAYYGPTAPPVAPAATTIAAAQNVLNNFYVSVGIFSTVGILVAAAAIFSVAKNEDGGENTLAIPFILIFLAVGIVIAFAIANAMQAATV